MPTHTILTTCSEIMVFFLSEIMISDDDAVSKVNKTADIDQNLYTDNSR